MVWIQQSYHKSIKFVSSEGASESTKDNIKSRIASTIQPVSLPDSNLMKNERQALKNMKTDKDIVMLPADKGRATAVMDKTDYYHKMDALINDKDLRST